MRALLSPLVRAAGGVVWSGGVSYRRRCRVYAFRCPGWTTARASACMPLGELGSGRLTRKASGAAAPGWCTGRVRARIRPLTRPRSRSRHPPRRRRGSAAVYSGAAACGQRLRSSGAAASASPWGGWRACCTSGGFRFQNELARVFFWGQNELAQFSSEGGFELALFFFWADFGFLLGPFRASSLSWLYLPGPSLDLLLPQK